MANRASAKRADPKTKAGPTERRYTALHVFNKSPDRHYFWVNQNDPDQGPDYWEAAGAEAVLYSKDPTAPRTARRHGQEGEEITSGGQLLMSMPMELHEDIVKNGMYGTTGQAMFDRIAERMYRDGTRMKSLRGVKPELSGDIPLMEM